MSLFTHDIKALLEREYPDYEFDVDFTSFDLSYKVAPTRYKMVIVEWICWVYGQLFPRDWHKSEPEISAQHAAIAPLLEVDPRQNVWVRCNHLPKKGRYLVALVEDGALTIRERTCEGEEWSDWPEGIYYANGLYHKGDLYL